MSFTGAELEALIPRMRRYAHALARHPVQPDDLVQDALERAWSRRRQWQAGSDLRAWVFAILHNVFVSSMRRVATRAFEVDATFAVEEPQAPTPYATAGTMLDIERALAALPADQRAVVLLVGLEDLGYREAADVLGIPIGTVMSRLSRGRARLRELMDGPSTVRPGTGSTLQIVRRSGDRLMSDPLEPFRLHAYVDGELTADEVATIERALADGSDAAVAAAAEVAALRAQKAALHARYDPLMTSPHRFTFGHPAHPFRSGGRHLAGRWFAPALAAMLVLGLGVGLAAGWFAHEHADAVDRLAARGGATAVSDETRLARFVQTATTSHAVFVPEVRHPVEVTAADEAHLVAWLSKRLDAPVRAPHLGEMGWNLLGGRLLPAEAGPVAQFMYQDAQGRRLTLAVSHTKGDDGSAARPDTAFRIGEADGNTVFYWIDADYSYALTGRLARSEMTALAGRVHSALDTHDKP